MFFTRRRAGRSTVARLFILAALATATVACGSGPLVPQQKQAQVASQDGILIEPVAPGSPMRASSLFADATPVFTVPQASAPAREATSTPTPTPQASPTPASASPTPSASSTPGATPTPSATPRPSTSVTPAVTATAALVRTAVTTVTVTTVQAASAAGAASGDMSSQEVALINSTRQQAGLPALRVNGTLSAAANSYAKFMADRNFFSHDGIDGSSPQSRIKASGYTGRFKGEALSAGQATPQSALNTWLNSPAHRDILMDRNAVEVGVGFYSKPGTTYTTYWVFVSGTP